MDHQSEKEIKIRSSTYLDQKNAMNLKWRLLRELNRSTGYPSSNRSLDALCISIVMECISIVSLR